jgi:hypothetical protein
VPVPKRRSRVEIVAEHLKQRGHISEGSALIEYGRFRLADVIHRLRNDRSDLLPEGKEIVTIHKQDTQGQNYGEYHLVETRASATRRRVEAVRQQLDTTDSRLAYRDELGFLGSLGPLGG